MHDSKYPLRLWILIKDSEAHERKFQHFLTEQNKIKSKSLPD